MAMAMAMAMARPRGGWRRIYCMYGKEDSGIIAGLLWRAAFLASLQILLLNSFNFVAGYVTSVFPFLPIQAWSFLLGFGMGVMALMILCFLVSALNVFYSGVVLQWKMIQRMLGMVEGWHGVQSVLDVGCRKGMLLNAVALKLKKEGSGGRVVGVDLWLPGSGAKGSMSETLRIASIEGVREFVTCKTGNPCDLPLMNDTFDVVVSALCLNNLGEETGRITQAAALQRSRGLLEIVRVLKPGGQAIIWDLLHVPEYNVKLQELGMSDIRISEPVSAFMVPSHVIYFRKPQESREGADDPS
ncbi:hypothetical protein O6H91_13G034500 [Diphasiastrum complanatum]|uniref:Uncharacterized protein n=2 Tax=Diphasiastrum complanatum TaxID=34168 RepID=A0ACC2BTM9_DIPCM|nr:hypothetical protein O6H91_13G034500 [Diphasiastrum complanatum]